MITFKTIIIPNNRRKDGTYPVKIRVTFKGRSRRLPTTMVCRQEDLTRSLKIKNPSVLAGGDALIRRMRGALEGLTPFDLEGRDVDWVVQTMEARMGSDGFHLDFFEWSERYILGKSEQTRHAYSCALNTLERFLGERRLDINGITRAMMLDFMESVDSSPKMHYNPATGSYSLGKTDKIPKAASTRHIAKLEHLFNAAKDRYNDEDSGRIVIPRSPFSTIKKVFPPSQGQRSIGMEAMQEVISSQTDDHLTRIALDAFIVSFALMGANLADLYFAKPFKGDWVYNRMKTCTRRADRAEMRVRIPVQVEPYIARLQEHAGAWWLPTLHWLGGSKDLCSARINRILHRWCQARGMQDFTFYAARHTWATVARSKARVEKALVDECLCHRGDYDLADIYAERDWELINEANQKVADLFEW